MHVLLFSLTIPQKMAFLNNSLIEQVEQVYLVCPDVSKDDIRRDLSVTSNVEETINRIFDGNFLNGFIEELQEENNTRNIDNNYEINLSDDDDLKDLPDIKIHSLNSTETRTLKRQLSDRETSSVKFARTHAEFSKVENIDVGPTQLNCGKTPDRGEIPDRQTVTVESLSDNVEFNKQNNILANIDLTSHPSEMSAVYNSDHRGSPISLSSSDDESNNTIELLNRIRGQRAKVTDNNNRANAFDIASISYKKPSQHNYEDYQSSEQFSYKSVDSMKTVSDSQETLDSVSSVVSSVSSSSSKSRKNRSAEEIAEHKQEALERKAQKQKERLEKKTEKAKELAKRKALQELKKSSRPEECMKYVTALVDPAVLESSGGGEVLAKLQSLECKTELRAQPMTNTISWTRDNIEHQLADDLQLQSFTTQTQEDVILIVIPTSDFVEMISNYRKEKSIGCRDSDDLRSFAQKAKRKYPEKTVTMVTIAMERYFRHQKTLQNRNFRAACLGTDASTKQTKTKKIKKVEDITACVTRLEVEEALVDLQLQEGCILKMIETTTELGDMVAMYTKAVAETPFKRERDKATFSFHVDTEWAGGVKIGKDGKGLLRLWRQQIQQFRNVSPEIAQAVVAEYPSPQLLLQAYSQCDSPQEAEKLLEDIMALQELKKSSRPEECMKYVTALVDPAVLESSGGGEVLAKLQSLECKTELRAQPMTNTISWTRDNIEHQLADDLQLQSFTTQTQEDVILIVIPTSDFVEMISNYRKEKSIGCRDSDDLRSFAQKAKRKYPEKTVTMVTIAMERYFRHQKTLQNRNFRAACLGTDASTKQTKTKKIKKVEDITACVTRLEVEEALVDLQLQEGCILKMIETTTELGDMVAMYTKAVAETPFKRERDKATFSFHVDTEWAGGVKIGKDGKGLLRLWRQQIQQFRNVSPEIAQAVVAEYPSPQLLLQAYSQCDSPQEAEKLLEDIMVRRGTGVLSRSRRVGKELSRRIYIQMTSRDNNQILH